LHPKEVEEIAQLEAAEKVARQAVKHAQDRIAKRAEMRQDADGGGVTPQKRLRTIPNRLRHRREWTMRDQPPPVVAW
jgi:hypothetical protein